MNRKICLLAALALYGCTNEIGPNMVHVEKGGNTCLAPSPELYVKNINLSFNGHMKEDNGGLSINNSKEISRIREENTRVDEFKEITFHLCHSYKQGDISPVEYKASYKKALSKLLGESYSSKALDEQMERIELFKLKEVNKVSMQLDDIYISEWRGQGKYINATFSIDKLSVSVNKVSLSFEGAEVLSKRFPPFDVATIITLNNGKDFTFPLATEQELLDTMNFNNAFIYKVSKSGDDNILDNVVPYMITVKIDFENKIINNIVSKEFNVFAHIIGA